MIDHFEYDGKLGAEGHATVLARDAVQSAAVLPGGLQGPVLFRGIGLSVSHESETVSRRPGLWWGGASNGTGSCAAYVSCCLAGAALGLLFTCLI